MQTEWYGDKRDLVKWGTLIHLCREHNLKSIIQVPFLLREKAWRYKLSIDGRPERFPAEVWRHFRDLNHIEALGRRIGLTIRVLGHEFSHQRRVDYVQKTCESLDRVDGAPKVVFLDPDTGIEPQQAGAKHVRIEEIKQIWRGLRPGDWLVLYQHALRKGGWEKMQRARFREACDGFRVKTYHCRKIAHDVVFFAVRRR